MSVGIPAVYRPRESSPNTITVEMVVSKENVFIVCYVYLLNLNMLRVRVFTGMSDGHGITPRLHRGTPELILAAVNERISGGFAVLQAR